LFFSDSPLDPIAMSSKAKIIVAVVLFVVAIGAIGYYLMSSKAQPAEGMRTPGEASPNATPPTDIDMNG